MIKVSHKPHLYPVVFENDMLGQNQTKFELRSNDSHQNDFPKNTKRCFRKCCGEFCCYVVLCEKWPFTLLL